MLINSRLGIYLLWSGTLVSIEVRAILVASLVILGILFLATFILVLRAAAVVNLVVLVVRL